MLRKLIYFVFTLVFLIENTGMVYALRPPASHNTQRALQRVEETMDLARDEDLSPARTATLVYLKKAHEGILPPVLADTKHSLDWPIQLDPSIFRINLDSEGPGLDVICKTDVPVRSIYDGDVVFISTSPARRSDIPSRTVIVMSDDGLLLHYTLMSGSIIPDKFNRYLYAGEKIRVQKGEVIGHTSEAFRTADRVNRITEYHFVLFTSYVPGARIPFPTNFSELGEPLNPLLLLELLPLTEQAETDSLQQEPQQRVLSSSAGNKNLLMPHFIEFLRDKTLKLFGNAVSISHIDASLKELHFVLDEEVDSSSGIALATAGCFICSPVCAMTDKEAGSFNRVFHHMPHSEAAVSINEAHIKEVFGVPDDKNRIFVIPYDKSHNSYYRDLSRYLSENYSNAKVLLIAVADGLLKNGLIVNNKIELLVGLGGLKYGSMFVPAEGSDLTISLSRKDLNAMFGDGKNVKEVEFSSLVPPVKASASGTLDGAQEGIFQHEFRPNQAASSAIASAA
ncbi:MAG: hypothetical protein HQ558_03160 [Candidatus Omnitrophica bacterium]|nr:hypothetical protein [Candidatus Omnitrophota bacterium]